MVKHGVIVSGDTTNKDWQELAKEHDLYFLGNKTREELIAELPALAATGKYDALVFPGGPWQGAINPELVGSLEGQLRFIAGRGAGYDHVSLDWLSSHGVYYVNSPGAVSDPTATTTVTLILTSLLHFAQMDANVKRGDWRKGVGLSLDVRDALVGIVGMGKIGKLVRDKIQALGSKVIYSNRTRLSPEEEKGAKYVTFEELITTADVITLLCPLTPETFHLLSTEQFNKMKDGVIIVNTSRGKVIDEPALVEALKSGKVDRAGLDVFENEPEVHPYLQTTDKVILLPHHASGTTRVYPDFELEVLGNLKEWLETGRASKVLNKPVLKN